VRLDATLSVEGQLWEVPVHLRGRLIQLRYDPFNWQRVEIWLNDTCLGLATRCNKILNSKTYTDCDYDRPINPPEWDTCLKTLWGACQTPFAAAVAQPFASPTFTALNAAFGATGGRAGRRLLHGPHGVGKTLLVQHFLQSLPEKRFKTFVLSHSSVTGTDLLRLLCLELGRTPRMRRGDNLHEIRLAWQQLDRLWPVLVLDEAQN